MMKFRVLSFLMLVFAVALAGCGKKPAPVDDSKPGTDIIPPPFPGTVPGPAAKSDYLLFARLDGKAIRDGSLYAELKQAVDKNGMTPAWDKMEGDAAKGLGFKPTDVDSVTVVVTEMPPKGEPKVIVILASSKPVTKGVAMVDWKASPPDARGFYKSGQAIVHYPDDKTAVMLHPDLAQKYLDGYAKDRSAWPLTADLSKAAAGHTAFATVNVQRLPTNELRPADREDFGPLLSANTVTITADLSGKTLKLAGRAGFPDAATATNAAARLQGFHKTAIKALDQELTPRPSGASLNALPSIQAPLKDFQRAFSEARIEASGSDVLVSAAYSANFDMAKTVADVVKEMKETAPRITASNNLKQIGVALHNHASAYQDFVPVHTAKVGFRPGDKPSGLSWRVALLPFIEQDNLYRQFKLDEPWDSENNKKLIEKMPKTYASPVKPGKPGYTPYQMVIGPSAMQARPYSIATIPDGTSNTIAIVEAAEPVIWTKPDDIMFPAKDLPKDFRKKFGGEFPGGFHACLWDGSVRFIKDSVSDRTLGLAINPNDGQPLGSDW